MQKILAFSLVLLAALYLTRCAFAALFARTKTKKGCGGSCGCVKKAIARHAALKRSASPAE